MSIPKLSEREQARSLRQQGFTLSQIADKLSIAKSSASLYTRDIVLTLDQMAVIEQGRTKARAASGSATKGARANQTIWEERRRLYQRQGWLLFERSAVFRHLVYLYWGEGAKQRTKASLTNSDPRILSLYIHWLDTQNANWKFVVHYYEENGFSESEIVSWWKEWLPSLTDEKLNKFWKKPASNRKTPPQNLRCPYGIGCVQVPSVKIRQIIEGGLERARHQVDSFYDKDRGILTRLWPCQQPADLISCSAVDTNPSYFQVVFRSAHGDLIRATESMSLGEARQYAEASNGETPIIEVVLAKVAESADASDSKSDSRKGVRVQVPPLAE